jgi:hypothetical protein
MTDAIIALNFKSHGINHRQKKPFTDEIESEYSNTVYYSKVCWLSKDKVL